MQQNPNQNPTPPSMGGMGAPGGEEKSSGALIGSIIIIIVLIAGGLYLWSNKMQENQMMDEMMLEDGMMIENGEMMPEEADAAAAVLSAQGTSDETAAIETDLNATNFNEMDGELNAY